MPIYPGTQLDIEQILAQLEPYLQKYRGVINIENIPPLLPSENDRYIVGESPTGLFSGHSDDLAEWDGTEWIFTTPVDGSLVWVQDLEKYYGYDLDSSLWTSIGSFLNTDNIPEGSTNLYFSVSNRNSWLSTLTSDNIAEGSNNKYLTALQKTALTGGNLTTLHKHSPREIQAHFSRLFSPYFYTSNTSWVIAGDFIFGGSIELGTPTSIEVIGWSENGTTTLEWQVYDLTNAQIVASGTTNTTAKSILSDTLLQNIPNNRALFELQIRRSGNNNNVYISELRVKW